MQSVARLYIAHIDRSTHGVTGVVHCDHLLIVGGGVGTDGIVR